VKDLIPHDAHSAEDDGDELPTTIGMRGINVLEGQPALSSLAIDREFKKEVEAGEDVELDLTPGALEKSNDPVRIYLREMGMTPLLTREGEVDIAKRIERGQLRTLKALSRSPIVIRQILAIGEDLERGIRSIKEVVVFDDEEITDEDILQNRVKETTLSIDELQKHYKRASQLAERLPTILEKKKAREYSRCRGSRATDYYASGGSCWCVRGNPVSIFPKQTVAAICRIGRPPRKGNGGGGRCLRTRASQTAHRDDQRIGAGVCRRKDCSRRYFGGPLQGRAGPRRASTAQTRDATAAEGNRTDAGVSTRYKDFTRRIRHTNDAGCNVRRDALGAGDRRFTSNDA
jgi:hypothetical protein